MALQQIDFTQRHFECQGRKFILKESLSFVRYRELQKLNLEFGFSATFYDIFKNIETAWNLLNSVKLAEAAVVLHNIMHGVVSLDEKEDPALRLCALFIDEEGEDPTKYDEAKMKEKIDYWKELDVSPFFQLAADLIPKWLQSYNLISQNGLSQPQKEKDE